MKFSDNIVRDPLDIVFVKRSESEMESREEYDSNLWEIEKSNLDFDKETGTKVHLYSTPARDIKVGENIYTNLGEFVAYRSN
jgi:hypothetical protein